MLAIMSARCEKSVEHLGNMTFRVNVPFDLGPSTARESEDWTIGSAS